METLFSMSGWKDVHDINFVTDHGRNFTADFTKSECAGLDVTVLINDNVSDRGGSWIFESIAVGENDENAFEKAVLFIQR